MIKLVNGDCLEVMKDIPDKSVDMILCDLPYGTTACRWDTIIPFEPLWSQYNRIIKDNGAIVLFGNSLFTYKLIGSNEKMYKYKWIWVKNKPTNFVNAKNRPMTKYEEICVFSKGNIANGSKNKMVYNPQGLVEINEVKKASPNRFGTTAGKRPSHKNTFVQQYTNYPNEVLDQFKEKQPNLKSHPNEKPVALLEYLIKTYTNEKELVLDNCMGSGSTGVACKNTNRNFIGIELDEKYFEIAKERIENEDTIK